MKNKLFESRLKVVNAGLEAFAEALESNSVFTVRAIFSPPICGDSWQWSLINSKIGEINRANQKAAERVLAAQPFLTSMGKAIDMVPGMRKNLILHAGPPVTWDRMCGPMKGAVIGALIYEKMAETPAEAEKLAAGGRIKFEPCHDHCCVGPMAGIISASMPVFAVKNKKFGNWSYATMNEGLGKVLRYGAYSKDVIERLKWMENVLYPVLHRAIKALGEIDLKAMTAQALHMGDEVHNRNRAGTSLLYRTLAPAIIKTSNPAEACDCLEFINRNDHFYLNLSMAMSKASLDPAAGVKNSSLVYIMARNGTDFGIKVSALGSKWFTGPALIPDALFFAGYSKKDAAPDIGDSAITETNGLGGFAIAAAPAIVQFVGGSAGDSFNYTKKMYSITCAENNVYKIPAMDFKGTPTGIDLIKVAKTGIMPFIDTGVAHKDPGVGQVGAGVVAAPKEPFQEAFKAFVNLLKR